VCGAYNEGYLPLCVQPCDPLASSCEPGWSCQAGPDVLGCLPDDTLPCGDTTCTPAETCLAAEFVPGCAGSRACCTPWCDLNDAMPCPDDLTCTPWFSEGTAPAGREHVGVCAMM
jgi:hypothetical protein